MTSHNSPHTVESGHTPGPWQVIEERHPWKFTRDGKEKSGEHVQRRIATVRRNPQAKDFDPVVTTSVGISEEPGKPVFMCCISEADARLIAAAPELLDALKETLADFKRWSEIRGGVGTYGPAISRIEAAISRTTGEN